MSAVKLVRLDHWRTGLILPGDELDPFVVDVSDDLRRVRSTKPCTSDLPAWEISDDWSVLIEHWDETQALVAGVVRNWSTDPTRFVNVPVRYSQIVRKLPPLAGPNSRMFAAGANFAEHAAAAFTAISGQPIDAEALLAERLEGLPPWGFSIVPGTVSADGALIKPPTSTAKLDYEAEIAVVLGAGGRDLRPDDVKFWGYAAACDFSIRDPFLGIGPPIDRGALTWALVKNWDTGNLLGPWLTSFDDGDDVNDLGIDLRVNGELRQSVNTRDMTYSFAEIAAYLSKFVALRAGDVILSGTGTGTAVERGTEGRYLREGDVVTLSTKDGTLNASIAPWS